MLAYILAVIKYIIYGTSVFFTGQLTSSTDILDILALRFLLSFVVFWVLKVSKVLKIKVGIKDIFSAKGKKNPVLILIFTAMFEPILYMLFETMGISMTNSITTAVILSLIPISSIICESVILKETTTILQKLFLLIGIIGVVYIAIKTGSSEGTNSIIGILFLVLAVCCGSLFQVFSRKSSKKFTAFEVSYFSCMLGAIVFNAVNIVRKIAIGEILSYFNPYFDLGNMVGFIFLSVVSTIIATSFGNYSLGKMQASTMAAFSGISTATSIIVGVAFGNETLYYYHYIGITLIIIRMVGVSTIAIRKDKLKLKTIHMNV